MSTPTGPTVFTRTLQLTTADSSTARDVVVRIGLPEPDPLPGGDFRVLVEVTGIDKPYARHFFGVDGLQAFLGACGILSQLLPGLVPAGARLTWLGDEHLGFGKG